MELARLPRSLPERGPAHAAIVALLLGLFLALLLTSLRSTSITTDEFGHLPLAYAFLETGDSGWLLMNPPSQRTIAALPLLFDRSVSLDAARPRRDVDFWHVGAAFQRQNRDAYVALYARARGAVAILACGTGLLAYGLARHLAGPRAGLLALLLFALSPDFLAHGGLVTTDLSAALAGLAAILATLRYVRSRTAGRLGLLAGSVSLLLLAKFTALTFLPVVSLLLVLGHRLAPDAAGDSGPTPAALAREHLLVGLGAWLVLLAAYGFQGVFAPLGGFELTSRPLSALASAAPQLRAPLPAAYLHALDLQLFDAARPWRSYLLGRVSLDRSFAYYPICLLYKLPLPMLLSLAPCAVFARRREWLALGPGLVFLAALVAMPGKQYGVRFALPTIAFLIVFVAVAAARPVRSGRLRRAPAVLAAALLCWYAADTLRAHPHYIAYFNELAGGPGLPHRGHEILADSNLDWGQDWIRLAEWQREQGEGELALAAFGLVDPAIHGVRYRRATCSFDAGTLAVSVNLVLGIDPFHRRRCFEALRDRVPDARVGASVWIYRLSPDGAGSPLAP